MTALDVARPAHARDLPASANERMVAAVAQMRRPRGAGDVLDVFPDVIRPPAFTKDALCIEHPEVDFFPERGESTNPAKRVCDACIVREDCLAHAVEYKIQHGIWGGTSERERRQVRELRRRADRATA